MRRFLKEKISLFGTVIKSAYPFEKVTRENNPEEYLVGLILNKLYSFQISLENTLLFNDVFLSIYLYRYAHELHIKIRYIFSSMDGTETKIRIDDFFADKDLKFQEYLNGTTSDTITEKLKETHQENYRLMSRFVHPNRSSLQLHLNRTDDQQFEFLVPNIRLTLWHISEILRLFSSLRLLNIHQKISKNNLDSLQS